MKRFKEGREDFEDDPRSGRPITAHTEDNIELLRQLIEEDPHSTYNQIEAETGLSQPVIYRILHESLKLRKIVSRWVPHEVTAANRKERVNACRENLAMFNEGKWRLCDVVTGDESWIYWRHIGRKSSLASWVAEGEPPRTVVQRGRFEAKNLFCVFFKSTGVVQVTCIAKAVVSYLDEVGLKLIRHPPYSPDLAPCDFWLFDLLKRNLTSHTSRKELHGQITDVLEKIPEKEYLGALNKWLERMQLCINNKGEYFEHLINK